MQLSYGVIPYIPKAEIAQNKPVKLIYRGHFFERVPQSIPVYPPALTGKITQLIYRGQTYDYNLPVSKKSTKTKAMNWRFL